MLWPTFNIDQVNTDNLGAGLDAADFSHVTTASGKTQLTYKGWPLYYYAPLTNGANTPEQPGQTKGDNFAGIWFVGKPDYTIMIVNSQLHGQDGVNYKSDYTPGQSNSTYFSDGKGLTLYTHSLDRSGKNNFTAADFSNNRCFWEKTTYL